MMKPAPVPIVALALLWLPFAAAAAGQTTPGSSSAQPTTTDPVTIVGCLEQGKDIEPSGERRPGSTVANADEFFLRTPAIAVPVGSTVTVGKPGPTGTGTTTSAGAPDRTTVYRVTGLAVEQLKPHVGHRVELQGRLSNNTANDTTARAATSVDASGRATTTVESRREVAGDLHATAVKMVSNSCS